MGYSAMYFVFFFKNKTNSENFNLENLSFFFYDSLRPVSYETLSPNILAPLQDIFAVFVGTTSFMSLLYSGKIFL